MNYEEKGACAEVSEQTRKETQDLVKKGIEVWENRSKQSSIREKGFINVSIGGIKKDSTQRSEEDDTSEEATTIDISHMQVLNELFTVFMNGKFLKLLKIFKEWMDVKSILKFCQLTVLNHSDQFGTLVDFMLQQKCLPLFLQALNKISSDEKNKQVLYDVVIKCREQITRTEDDDTKTATFSYHVHYHVMLQATLNLINFTISFGTEDGAQFVRLLESMLEIFHHQHEFHSHVLQCLLKNKESNKPDSLPLTLIPDSHPETEEEKICYMEYIYSKLQSTTKVCDTLINFYQSRLRELATSPFGIVSNIKDLVNTESLAQMKLDSLQWKNLIQKIDSEMSHELVEIRELCSSTTWQKDMSETTQTFLEATQPMKMLQLVQWINKTPLEFNNIYTEFGKTLQQTIADNIGYYLDFVNDEKQKNSPFSPLHDIHAQAVIGILSSSQNVASFTLLTRNQDEDFLHQLLRTLIQRKMVYGISKIEHQKNSIVKTKLDVIVAYNEFLIKVVLDTLREKQRKKDSKPEESVREEEDILEHQSIFQKKQKTKNIEPPRHSDELDEYESELDEFESLVNYMSEVRFGNMQDNILHQLQEMSDAEMELLVQNTKIKIGEIMWWFKNRVKIQKVEFKYMQASILCQFAKCSKLIHQYANWQSKT
jgi:hypothetical protein